MKKLTIALLLVSSIAFSQEKGSVFLSVFPTNAVIRLNDSLLKSHETYLLDTGSYNIKMWSPTREYVERTFNIQAEKTTRLHEVLTASDDYKKFKMNTFIFHVEKTFIRYVPPIVLGISIFTTLSYKNDMNKEYELANTAKSNYDNAFIKDDLLSYKNSYEEHRNAYDNNVKKYNTGLIVSGVLVLSTAALQYLSFKLKKPVYTEKVLLSSITFDSYNNNIVPSISLAYKFK